MKILTKIVLSLNLVTLGLLNSCVYAYIPIPTEGGYILNLPEAELNKLNNPKNPHEERLALNEFILDDLPKFGEGLVIKPSTNKDKKIKVKSFYTPGFSKSQAANALNLLNRVFEVEKNTKVVGEENTNLQDSINSLLISFKFKPFILPSDFRVIGFTPFGGYDEGKGWSGVVQIFEGPSLGRCRYTVDYYKSYEGAIYINDEDVIYWVNNKVTTFEVLGMKGHAFMYNLGWVDDSFIYTLECANLHYSYEVIKSMIMLAKDIDVEQGKL